MATVHGAHADWGASLLGGKRVAAGPDYAPWLNGSPLSDGKRTPSQSAHTALAAADLSALSSSLDMGSDRSFDSLSDASKCTATTGVTVTSSASLMKEYFPEQTLPDTESVIPKYRRAGKWMALPSQPQSKKQNEQAREGGSDRHGHWKALPQWKSADEVSQLDPAGRAQAIRLRVAQRKASRRGTVRRGPPRQKVKLSPHYEHTKDLESYTEHAQMANGINQKLSAQSRPKCKKGISRISDGGEAKSDRRAQAPEKRSGGDFFSSSDSEGEYTELPTTAVRSQEVELSHESPSEYPRAFIPSEEDQARAKTSKGVSWNGAEVIEPNPETASTSSSSHEVQQDAVDVDEGGKFSRVRRMTMRTDTLLKAAASGSQEDKKKALENFMTRRYSWKPHRDSVMQTPFLDLADNPGRMMVHAKPQNEAPGLSSTDAMNLVWIKRQYSQLKAKHESLVNEISWKDRHSEDLRALLAKNQKNHKKAVAWLASLAAQSHGNTAPPSLLGRSIWNWEADMIALDVRLLALKEKIDEGLAGGPSNQTPSGPLKLSGDGHRRSEAEIQLLSTLASRPAFAPASPTDRSEMETLLGKLKATAKRSAQLHKLIANPETAAVFAEVGNSFYNDPTHASIDIDSDSEATFGEDFVGKQHDATCDATYGHDPSFNEVTFTEGMEEQEHDSASTASAMSFGAEGHQPEPLGVSPGHSKQDRKAAPSNCDTPRNQPHQPHKPSSSPSGPSRTKRSPRRHSFREELHEWSSQSGALYGLSSGMSAPSPSRVDRSLPTRLSSDEDLHCNRCFNHPHSNESASVADELSKWQGKGGNL